MNAEFMVIQKNFNKGDKKHLRRRISTNGTKNDTSEEGSSEIASVNIDLDEESFLLMKRDQNVIGQCAEGDGVGFQEMVN